MILLGIYPRVMQLCQYKTAGVDFTGSSTAEVEERKVIEAERLQEERSIAKPVTSRTSPTNWTGSN